MLVLNGGNEHFFALLCNVFISINFFNGCSKLVVYFIDDFITLPIPTLDEMEALFIASGELFVLENHLISGIGLQL